jgi:hypothetical protein
MTRKKLRKNYIFVNTFFFVCIIKYMYIYICDRKRERERERER